MTTVIYIGIILGILGLVIPLIVSIAIALIQRNKKEITYKIESDVSLLSFREEVKNKLEILYEGKKVSNTNLVILTIRNTGKVPILPSDYISPINFDFGKESEILSYDIIKTNPPNIKDKISLNVETGKLILKPSLLNKGFFITIKAILTQYEGQIEADALIAGIDHIKKIASNKRPNLLFYSRIAINFLYAFTALIIGIYNFDHISSIKNGEWQHNIFYFNAVVLLLLMALLIFNNYNLYLDYKHRGRARIRSTSLSKYL